MPGSLDLLQVVELQFPPDQKVSGGGIAKELRHVTNAFSPETCTRQVMMFFEISNKKTFDRWINQATKKLIGCKHLTGPEAYGFLLSWICGGEYRVLKKDSKLTLFNDNHVLGKFKSKWGQFLKPQPKDNEKTGEKPKAADVNPNKKEFIAIVDILLRDAHEIRKRMEAGEFGKGDKLRMVLNIVISNVLFSRCNQLPVSYDFMDQLDYKKQLHALVEGELVKLDTQKVKYESAASESAADKRQNIQAKVDFYKSKFGLFEYDEERTRKMVTRDIIAQVSGCLS